MCARCSRSRQVSCSACLVCRILDDLETAGVSNGQALMLLCEHHFNSPCCVDDLLQVDLALSASGGEGGEGGTRSDFNSAAGDSRPSLFSELI